MTTNVGNSDNSNNDNNEDGDGNNNDKQGLGFRVYILRVLDWGF
jgi:hypothetical protein